MKWISLVFLVLLLIAGLAHSTATPPKSPAAHPAPAGAPAQPVTPPTIDPMTILDRVDQFYDRAWNRLLGLLALVGLVVPFLTWLVQRAIGRRDRARLLRDFEVRISTATKEASEAAEARLRTETGTVMLELFKKANAVEAGVYLVQGNFMAARNDWGSAIASFANGVQGAIVAIDENTLRTCVRQLRNAVVQIPAANYQAADSDVSRAIGAIASNNQDGGRSHMIDDLRGARDARLRSAEAASGPAPPPPHAPPPGPSSAPLRG